MFWMKFFKVVGLAASGFGALYVQPVRPVVITGASMEPTYHNLEFTLATSEFTEIKAGDVVLVRNGRGTFLKRVAFVPGDKVMQFRDPSGNWSDLIRVRASDRVRDRLREVKVPVDHYYVLGDNMPMSVDSREFGPVSRHQIIAKVLDPRPWPKESQPFPASTFDPKAAAVATRE